MKGWRIAPTGLGIGFVLMLFALLLIAINFSNNLIFTLCFFLMAAFLLSVWFVIRNMNGIEVVNVRVKPVHLGQKINYQISVKDLVGADHLYIELNGSDRYFHLPADTTQIWNLDLNADKRGLSIEQPLEMSCIWPLGLFTFKRKIAQLPEVLIYPEAHDLAVLDQPASGSAAHSQSEAEELDGLREYQAGDNLKRIDWRAVARRGQLQVKHFDGADGDPSLWLDWNNTQGLDYESRISCICHWVLECQQAGREFGLRLPAKEIDPNRTGQHAQQCLSELAMMPEEVVS